MNDIILYFTIKYKGNWDDIYSALTEKEKVNLEDVKKIPKKIKRKYISIIDDNYPYYLKTIYKPPFSIFWYGNIDLLDINLISITGFMYDKFEEQFNYIKKMKDTAFVVKYENEFLIKKMIENNLKIIVVSDNGVDIKNKLFLDIINSNNLIISEIPELSKNKDYQQYSDRIFIGLSKLIIFMTDTLPNKSNRLIKICKSEKVQVFTFFENKNTKQLTENLTPKLEKKLS